MVPLARYLPCPLEAAYPNSLTRHEMRVFRCWVSTSRCRARLTLRSPPTRTRRAPFGRHAAADGLRRIISSLAGCVRSPGANSISSFCSNDSLGRPQLHSPSLACRVFLIQQPYSSKTSVLLTKTLLNSERQGPFSRSTLTGLNRITAICVVLGLRTRRR